MLGERSDQRGLLEAGQLYLDPVGRDTFYPPVADWRHCEASCSTMPTTTSTRNDGWWRSIDWLGWSSWASGRRYFGRVKTKFQLYLAATVANLTLLANQAGVGGDPGDDSATSRPPQLAAITAWIDTFCQLGCWPGSGRQRWRYHSSQPGLFGPLSSVV